MGSYHEANGKVSSISGKDSRVIESAIHLIEDIAASSDEFGRAEIQHALRKVQYSLETPFETMCQLTLARLGADMGLYKYLATCDEPQTVTKLAEHFGAGHDFMERILRCASSFHMIQETSQGAYAPNNISRALSVPGYEAGIYHAFDNLGPVLLAFPDYMADTKYQDIRDGEHCVFQKVFNTDLHAFRWIAHNPNRLSNFINLMTVERSPNWLSTFPMQEELQDWTASNGEALFVDMGAGLGQGCTQIRDRYPNVPGRIVLQELPPFIQIMKPIEHVELMAHNFFTLQPVQGAKFYFLRLILRDYTDDQAVEILNQIVPAMTHHSRIIVDDGVTPEKNPCWDETGTDICIMAALGSRERTRRQWEHVFARAGLRIASIHPYTKPVVNAAMVLAKDTSVT